MSLKHLTKVKTNWLKVRDLRSACFIGKEVLAVGMGCHILLMNVINRQETFYRATDRISGEGVSCLAGHKSFSIFAFAESCVHPRIFIVAYPDNSVLFTLDGDGKTSSYVSLCFSEGEYLLALSGIPDYGIEIYVWRNKEMLVKRRTDFKTDKQLLLCSPASTATICQLAYNQAMVTLWEIHGNVRIARLIEKNVKLPFGKEAAPLNCTFSIDGTLMVINRLGNVYSFSATSGQLNHIIKYIDEPGTMIPLVFYCKGGLFLSNPNGSCCFYKRQKGSWNQLWFTKPPETFNSLIIYSASDGLYGTTANGHLVRTVLDNDLRNVEFIPVKEFDCQFTNFVLLSPLGEHLIASNLSNGLVAINSKTGTKVSEYSLSGMSCMTENPMFPFVTVGTSNGIVLLISFYRPEEPVELTSFHLSHVSIKTITFSTDGIWLAAFDERHNVFLIKGVPGSTMDVILHHKLNINQFQATFDVNDNIVTIVGILSEKDIKYSRRIIRSTISLKDNKRREEYGLASKFYTQLERKKDESEKLYAVCLLTSEIDLLHIETDNQGQLDVHICSTIRLKHQVPYFHINVDPFHLISWSIDGLVNIYDAKSDNFLAYALVHDRSRLGVKLAKCDPLHQYIFTLGHTGYLVCTKMHRSAATIERLNDLRLSLETDDVIAMFQNPTTGFSPKGFTFTRWIDMEKISRLESEKLQCKHERLKILKDFKAIKTKLKQLLDDNESATAEQRIPIQKFNLSASTTEQLKEKAKIKRQEEHQKLLTYITEQTKVNNKIILKCWDVMKRKPVKVRSIFTKLAVENYPSLPNERDESLLLKMAVYRETELMASHDALLPWKPTPTYQLESILNRDPDYGNMIDVLSRSAMQKHTTLTGTTTHLYVEPISLRFEQLEVVTFEQLYFDKVYGNIQILQLRDLFNKKFDALKALKDLEMEVVLKRNSRLRDIHSELKIIFKLLEMPQPNTEEIIDPHYQLDEIPHTIVKTEDCEISVKPFLTPSMENLLALEKAEKERRQRELMADDFKDRALMMMMDGVLEHRWEDEIKKTPAVPHCLETGKDPQHYNEADIREVKDYEEQIQFLYKERMRYKKILEIEKADILANLEDQIKKFNTKVGECLLEKIRIEAAIREEEMRILRNTFYNHQRLVYDRIADTLREEIDAANKHIDLLTETLNELQDKVNDYKNTYESLSTKDRLLDKQFKINFSDTAQSAIVDQAYKIFKRRPKAQLKAVVSVSIFQDLAKRITTKKAAQQSNTLLPQECIDYLAACDTLDQASNCPAGMDNNLWQTLCKMRRIKIESEFRLKSCEIQLADSEAAFNAFQKEITSKRNSLSALETKLQDIFNEKFEESTNRTVQIIMKRGLIEVPMSGKMKDFDSCILIHRTDVDDINVVIKRAGSKKLKAMVNAAQFRRKIIAQEWDHKALKLKIRDLKDQVKMIEKCKITKEVQDWLKRKERGFVEDLSQLALEREIENTIYAQEKMLQEIKKSVEELEEKINAKRKENKLLDKQTQELNVDVTEQHLQKDSELEEAEQKASQARMAAIVDRARWVRLVQTQHAQILELGTMLELQRLKTYPTLTAPPVLIDPRHVK